MSERCHKCGMPGIAEESVQEGWDRSEDVHSNRKCPDPKCGNRWRHEPPPFNPPHPPTRSAA